MNKMFFGKVFFMSVAAMLMISVGSVSGQTLEKDNTEPYMEVYDANDNLVKSYSDEEIETLMEEAKEMELSTGNPVINNTSSAYNFSNNKQLVQMAAASSTYKYGATSFSSNISLSGGKYFNNPADITINPKKKFEGLLIKLYKQGYTIPSGSIKVGNFVGGIHVPLKSLWNGSGNHKVQFNNANSNGATINLNAGTLYYN